MERTEAYEASVKNLMEEYDIAGLTDLLDDLTTFWDPDDDEKYDFINSYEYYKTLSDEDLIVAIKEAIDTKISECEPKARAAAKYFDCNPDEVDLESYDHYGLEVYSYGREEVAVGTEEEADDAADEEIKNSLWAFNVSFIESHMRGSYPLSERSSKALEKMLGELCEDANDIVEALIDDMDEFVKDAISSDGRGNFLSQYDGEENEVEVDGDIYYVYRVN